MLERRGDPPLQPRHGVAVVVGPESEQRQNESDLCEQELPVRRVPEPVEGLDFLVSAGSFPPGLGSRRRRLRGSRTRERLGRQRPASSSCQEESEHREGQPSDPHRGRRDVHDVDDDRDRPAVRAWPAAAIVGSRSSAGTRRSRGSVRVRARPAKKATGAITAARTSCQRNAFPNRVSSTESTVSQRKASLSPKPPARAPCRTMQRNPAITSPTASPARIRYRQRGARTPLCEG